MLRSHRFTFSILLIFGLSLTACGKPNPDKILVQGESFKMTVGEFEKIYEQRIQRSPLKPSISVMKQLRRKILQERINQVLLERHADELGIMISEDEIGNYVQKFKSLYSTLSFEEALKAVGLSETTFHQKQQLALKIQKMIDQELARQNLINAESIQKYYDAHPEISTIAEEVRIRQIVTDTQEKAELILHRLNQGENFAKLARDLSLSPDQKQGGDLGFIKKGQFPREFEVCFSMNPGEISPIIPSLYGFHLFKVLEKNPPRKLSLEESQDRIIFSLKQEMREKVRQGLLDELLQKAKIKINEETLERL